MSVIRAHPPDRIRISNLELHLPNGLGPSAFGLTPAPPCPAFLSLEIELDDSVVPSCTEDDTMGGLGINYSSTSKALIAACQAGPKAGKTTGTDSEVPNAEGSGWSGPEELIRALSSIPLELDVVHSVSLSLELPKALLPARSAVYSASFDANNPGGWDWRCEVKDLKVRTIIGLHPHERQMRQWLEVDVGVENYAEGWDHRLFAEGVYDWLDKSEYRTIEALIDALARYILTDPAFRDMLSEMSELNITLRKPSALAFACPVIQIRRSRGDYEYEETSAFSTWPARKARTAADAGPTSAYEDKTPSQTRDGTNASTVAGPSNSAKVASPRRVFVAIGSNIGDRIAHLRRAVDHVAEQEGMRLVSTSRLYESEPMYVEDQDRFINGVIELESSLAPLDVLRVLKNTERFIGRTKTFRNGPRVVDLDLLAYGEEHVQIGQVDDPEDEDGVGWLECPHPRIREREFVLRPWADLAPRFVLPGTGHTISDTLANLLQSTPPSLAPIIPFPHPARPLRLEFSPRLMQIFNATPDSFSDGHSDNLDIPLALANITALFDRSLPPPPDILDIGGMSTRPGSTPCTEQEELERVVPLIRAIRASADERINTVPISVDTYRANVARAAVEAGASCINDVRGGAEPGMKETMADLGVPVVLMHSRGDSSSMGSAALQDYAPLGGVMSGVRQELGQRVQDALRAGVKRWDVTLDPGLGFAKSHDDNLTLLRRIAELNTEEVTGEAPAPEIAEEEKTGRAESVPANDREVHSALAGLPILVGGSRKGFVGRSIGRAGKNEASQRGYGDAAVTAWCAAAATATAAGEAGAVSAGQAERGVSDGAAAVAVLRVHDSRAMGEVLSMWRAIEGAGALSGAS